MQTYVPNISAPLMPISRTKALDRRHDTTMRQNVNAFAVLTRYGFCAPPAPREFIAPQMPGAPKLHRPRMVILKNVDLYHFTNCSR